MVKYGKLEPEAYRKGTEIRGGKGVKTVCEFSPEEVFGPGMLHLR